MKLTVSLTNQALQQNPIQLIVKRRATSLGLFQLLRLQVLKSLDVILVVKRDNFTHHGHVLMLLEIPCLVHKIFKGHMNIIQEI